MYDPKTARSSILERFNLAHKVRMTVWLARHIKNWPAVLLTCLGGKSASRVIFRDGRIFLLYTPRTEIRAVYEVFGEDFYTPPCTVPADGHVMDIGANIGCFSVRAASELVPSGRVISVEPNPRCCDTLRRNVAANRLSNVEMLQGGVGIGGDSGRLFVNPSGSGWGSMYSSVFSTESAVPVQLFSPRALLGRLPTIDFLKVDCEGAEHCLFWETDPADWRGVRSMALEYHLFLKTGYPSDGDLDSLISRISFLGFEIKVLRQTNAWLGQIIASRIAERKGEVDPGGVDLAKQGEPVATRTVGGREG